MSHEFRRKVFRWLSALGGGLLGGAFGIAIGNLSGGVLASTFWGKGSFFSSLMVGICFIMIGISIYLIYRGVSGIYALYAQKEDSSVAKLFWKAIEVAFFITYLLQIVIWLVATIWMIP